MDFEFQCGKYKARDADGQRLTGMLTKKRWLKRNQKVIIKLRTL